MVLHLNQRLQVWTSHFSCSHCSDFSIECRNSKSIPVRYIDTVLKISVSKTGKLNQYYSGVMDDESAVSKTTVKTLRSPKYNIRQRGPIESHTNEAQKLSILHGLAEHYKSLPQNSAYARHRLKLIQHSINIMEVERSVWITVCVSKLPQQECHRNAREAARSSSAAGYDFKQGPAQRFSGAS